MKTFDFLCIMATNSNKDVVYDQIESLFWGLGSNFGLIIVNDGNNELNFSQSNIFTIKPKGTIHSASKVGFKINEGLKWALENNINFKCAMILDDDALIINRGLSDWFIEKFEKNKNLGMIAVGDDNLANKNYSDKSKHETYKNLLFNWIGTRKIIIPKKYAFYAVNFQSYNMIRFFHEKKLLDYEKEKWPYPCETFQTIICNSLDFEIELHGQYPDNLVPPLYVMHHGSKNPMDPRNLPKSFLIHHSIRHVKNVGEWEIRKFYRKKRINKLL